MMPLDPQLPTSTHSADGRFVSDINRIDPECSRDYLYFIKNTTEIQSQHNWSLEAFDNETKTAWVGAYGLGFKRHRDNINLMKLYLPFKYKSFNIKVIDVRGRKEPSIGYIKYLTQTGKYK